jgi:putative ABC transport system permease protein
MSLRGRLSRLAALLRARRLDDDLDAEIQTHLELAEEDARARGVSPEEARREAKLSFGGVDGIREAHRDRRSVRWIETFLKDFRYGLSSLLRRPGFSIVAVGVLAFGVGTTTVMFSLVDSVLLRPMPYANPDRIVRLWEVPRPGSINQTTNGFFDEWRRRSQSFDAMAASRPAHITATIGGDPVRLSGVLATADYFNVFGVHAAIGRTFMRDDDQPGHERVLVLSHAAWQSRFGGDPAAVGQQLIVDNSAYRVIGVLPAGSFDREPTRSGPNEVADFWMPLAFTADDLTRGEHQNDVVARLRAGVGLAQAQQDLLAVQAGVVDHIPASEQKPSVVVEPFDLRLIGDGLRRMLWLSFGAVVAVLLITCANIASLLLARGASRRREMAVRAALGASRSRLVTQLLTETLALCAIGGLGGVAVAGFLIQAAVPFLPPDVPSYVDVTLHPRALAFASIVVLGVTLLVGIVPSLRASAGALASAMNAGSRGSSAPHRRIHRAIVIGEVAASMVLVCGAILLSASLAKLQRTDIGARVDRILTLSVDLLSSDYPTPERAVQFMDNAIAALQGVPGVTAASVSSDIPLGGSGGEGLTVAGQTARTIVRFKRVDAGYFTTFDIPIVDGRGILRDDRPGAPRVVVVNTTLARRLRETFGFANVVGRTVTLPALTYDERLGSPREEFQIVGIVGNERIRRDLRQPLGNEEAVYVALAQSPKHALKISVLTSGDPLASWAGVRNALRVADSRLAIGDVETMAQVKTGSMSSAAAPAWVMSAFAAVALLLAALGLYGVLAHSVAQQAREIGIRLALGATPRDVRRGVAGQAFVMIAIGLAAGLCGALAFVRVTSSLLFEISPFDPSSFAGAAAIMLTAGLAAAVVPALRASRVDPTLALRTDD